MDIRYQPFISTPFTHYKAIALYRGFQELHGNPSPGMILQISAQVCGSFYGSFTPSGSLSRTSLASEVTWLAVRDPRIPRLGRPLLLVGWFHGGEWGPYTWP